MMLDPGTSFGSCEILEPLGAGDMGEVVVSKNTNELKTRVRRDVSDRRVSAWFAKGS